MTDNWDRPSRARRTRGSLRDLRPSHISEGPDRLVGTLDWGHLVLNFRVAEINLAYDSLARKTQEMIGSVDCVAKSVSVSYNGREPGQVNVRFIVGLRVSFPRRQRQRKLTLTVVMGVAVGSRLGHSGSSKLLARTTKDVVRRLINVCRLASRDVSEPIPGE
ncbi:hypothetical protein XA68_16722 [Ophiocordyceps unilateralis]|uniref:Uncharacterized protein n=1 Tax=Ophiocordyceps unilateralis TaxID=268505 RepID=A0A2A9P4F8_OPHUN|nr:hypothetical protein XA68_16722 [Ophiocordyceps unilateralis]